jgi:hypothetical protein
MIKGSRAGVYEILCYVLSVKLFLFGVHDLGLMAQGLGLKL